MHQHRVASLRTALSGPPSRREALRGLAGLGLGLVGLRAPEQGEARKKHKHKHKKHGKKAKPNAFGCLEVGGPCQTAEQCCSGICDGKKGKRTCRAHGVGTCDQRAEGFCTAPVPSLTSCNNSAACACFRTTAGSNFCANFIADDICTACKTDADCEALGFPAGSACVPSSVGNCAGLCETGMICWAPCAA